MYRHLQLLVFAVVFSLWANPKADAGEASLSFSALTVTGEKLNVTAAPDGMPKLTVVCFLGAECPMARIYGPRLNQLAADFVEHEVRVIGINSNRQDSFGDVKGYVDELEITFPFIRDKDNVIADQFEALRTPEVFLLNSSLDVLYRGRIDDQYEPGVNRSTAKRRDLLTAIQETLDGKPVSVSRTDAQGCLIGRVNSREKRTVAENSITYTQHVVPVLQQHCIECHRSQEIGPFAMDSYGEVAGWADTMLETIENGRMPPWHADPNFGDFSNCRHMPEKDKQIIRDWIAGGLKEGDASKLPPAIEYVEGWQLGGKPDQVIAMRSRPYTVPKDGVVEYQYFVVDPGFREDKWISGAQVIPGSRSVVHHAIVFVRPPDGSNVQGLGWLGAYVPGQRLVPMPPGRARRIPAGSKFVFQMHYTPNGKVQEDITKVGIKFIDEPNVTHEVFTLIALNQEFEIPPHAENHVVKAEVPWMPPRAELLAASPHMHYRGKSFRLLSAEDDSEILLDVPRYDFNWQHSYTLKEPIPLENLTSLRFEAAFDNSDRNPFNPDPKQWVTWGDQTWEEMAVAFFEVAQPRKLPTASNAKKDEKSPAELAERTRKIDTYVKRVFATMDANQDGEISESEAPIVVRHFLRFYNLDRDGDGTATRDEIHELATRIYP